MWNAFRVRKGDKKDGENDIEQVSDGKATPAPSQASQQGVSEIYFEKAIKNIVPQVVRRPQIGQAARIHIQWTMSKLAKMLSNRNGVGVYYTLPSQMSRNDAQSLSSYVFVKSQLTAASLKGLEADQMSLEDG